MNTTKITGAEISDLKISSLPSRPTMPVQYGGRGYSGADMKAAFDALPLYIIERFNSLIDDIKADVGESLASEMRAGIDSLPTLAALLMSIERGDFADVCRVGGESLSAVIAGLRADVESLRGAAV